MKWYRYILRVVRVTCGDRPVVCWSQPVPVHRSSLCLLLHNLSFRDHIASLKTDTVTIFTPQILAKTNQEALLPSQLPHREPVVKCFQHATVKDTKPSVSFLLISSNLGPIIQCFEGNDDLYLIQGILASVRGFPGSPRLGLCVLTTEGPGSLPGPGTKASQAIWCSQKKKKEGRANNCS